MFRDRPATDDPPAPTPAPPRRETAADVPPPGELVLICFVCRAFRDHEGGWAPAHAPVGVDAGRTLTHGLCPSCLDRLYPDAPAPPAGS